MRVHELLDQLKDANPFAEVYFYVDDDDFYCGKWFRVDVVDEYSNRIELYEWI